MRDGLNATGREIYFSLCGWNSWYSPVGQTLGNSWRIAGDCNGVCSCLFRSFLLRSSVMHEFTPKRRWGPVSSFVRGSTCVACACGRAGARRPPRLCTPSFSPLNDVSGSGVHVALWISGRDHTVRVRVCACARVWGWGHEAPLARAPLPARPPWLFARPPFLQSRLPPPPQFLVRVCTWHGVASAWDSVYNAIRTNQVLAANAGPGGWNVRVSGATSPPPSVLATDLRARAFSVRPAHGCRGTRVVRCRARCLVRRARWACADPPC
jgi:hypothetical protein